MADTKPRGDLAADISLIRGGPFYHAQEVLRLIEPKRWNLVRRVVVSIAVGWVPLILLTLLFLPSQLRSILTDYHVYARTVIAVPVLLVGQVFMESRFQLIIRALRDPNLLTTAGAEQLEKALATVRKLRDSFAPELILVIGLLVLIFSTLQSRIHSEVTWGTYLDSGGRHLSAAGWYFVFVSTLFFLLLLGVSLWKWLIWSYFLFKVSKMDLVLVAIHPDRRGGLGFLGFSPQGFVPIAFAVAFTLGANWRFQLLHENASFLSVKLPIVVLVIIVAALAFGPLLFFVPRLAKVRRQAIVKYGELGRMQSTAFERKWIDNREGHEEEFRSTPEVSALIDYGSSFTTILAMKPILVDRSAVSALVAAVLLPILPAIAAEMPLTEAFKKLLEGLR
jgi:hypothetical protein